MSVVRFELKAFGIERAVKLEVLDKPVSHYSIDIGSGSVRVVYTDGTSNKDLIKNVDQPVKAMTGVVSPKSESEDAEVGDVVKTETEEGTTEEVKAAGEPVSEEAAKADAHQAGDSEASGGTTAGPGEPNVVISGGTPTVDGKKPTTRGRRATNK